MYRQTFDALIVAGSLILIFRLNSESIIAAEETFFHKREPSRVTQ